MFLLFICTIITVVLTYLYFIIFNDKTIKNKLEMYKNVGSIGITQTEVTSLFGVVSFKNDFDENKNIICYSYREKIKKGQRILITDYDLINEMYVVEEYPNIGFRN